MKVFKERFKCILAAKAVESRTKMGRGPVSGKEERQSRRGDQQPLVVGGPHNWRPRPRPRSQWRRTKVLMYMYRDRSIHRQRYLQAGYQEQGAHGRTVPECFMSTRTRPQAPPIQAHHQIICCHHAALTTPSGYGAPAARPMPFAAAAG